MFGWFRSDDDEKDDGRWLCRHLYEATVTMKLPIGVTKGFDRLGPTWLPVTVYKCMKSDCGKRVAYSYYMGHASRFSEEKVRDWIHFLQRQSAHGNEHLLGEFEPWSIVHRGPDEWLRD